MEYKKRIQDLSNTITKDEFGRVITTETRKTFSVKIDQDEFYMSYIEQMSGFFKLTSATDIKILTIICGYAEFNTGKVNLTTIRREEICDTLSIKNSQISRSLKSLKDKGLISIRKDELEVNPMVFWKGTNETRNKMLKESGLEIKIKFQIKEEEE
jgi:predicted transcriptional regulator